MPNIRTCQSGTDMQTLATFRGTTGGGGYSKTISLIAQY